jgi:hypothetical protein
MPFGLVWFDITQPTLVPDRFNPVPNRFGFDGNSEQKIATGCKNLSFTFQFIVLAFPFRRITERVRVIARRVQGTADRKDPAAELKSGLHSGFALIYNGKGPPQRSKQCLDKATMPPQKINAHCRTQPTRYRASPGYS